MTTRHAITLDTPTLYAFDFGASIQATSKAIDMSKDERGALVCLVDGDEDELFELCEARTDIDGATLFFGVDLDGDGWRVAVPA